MTRTSETLGPAGGALKSLGSRAPLTTLSGVSGTGTVFTTKSTPVVCGGEPRIWASEGPKRRVAGHDEHPTPTRPGYCVLDSPLVQESDRTNQPRPMPRPQGVAHGTRPTPSLFHRQPCALWLVEKCSPRGHSNSSASNFPGLLKELWKLTPSGLGDDSFSLSLGQPTTPTSHQGVVLLELRPVAAEDLRQSGLAHRRVSCGVRGEENHHCQPRLETPTAER